MTAIAEVVLATIGVLFLLADVRTFTSALYQTLFGALPNTTLGVIAIAVFAASALAPIAGRAGARRGIAITGAILALATLLATATRNGWLDVLVTGVGLVAGTWWLALLHSARPTSQPERPSPLPRALPFALVSDLALRTVFDSVPVVDLPLQFSVPLVLVAVAVFLTALLATSRAVRGWTAPAARDVFTLAALPPLLLVTETGALNGAQIAGAAGIELTTVGTVAAGIGIVIGVAVMLSGRATNVVGAALIAAGATALWLHTPVISLVGGALLAGGAIVAAASFAGATPRPAGSPLATSMALALGWVALVAGAFGFYAFYAFVPAVLAITALVAAATLVSAPSAARLGRALALVLAVLAVVPPLFALATERATIDTLVAPVTFRFMTYNVHQGFSADDAADLDGLVATIQREGPDVLVLQEVVRGWLIDEQHDVLGVLAERLGMRYVFGPNIGDLYGNAILSKYPITDVRRIHYVKEPGARYQPRGAILAHVAGVLVIVTHLDEHEDASAVRQEQVRELLDAWAGEKVAILAGDLNAADDSRELALLDQAAFGDLAQLGGAREPTFPSWQPVKRLDYVFGIGVTASQAHTVASRASDHRALVVNVRR